MASRSSAVSRPLATDRSRLPAIRSRPATARARSGSYRVTCLPTAACTWAIPWPISPAPATNTRSTLIAAPPLVDRGQQVGPPRRRGRARGSRRPRSPRRCRPQRRRREALPEPLDEDRAHLGRGARPAGGGGRTVAPRGPVLVERREQRRARRRRSSAVVTRTSGRFGAGRDGSASLRATVGTSIARSCAAVRCAPGRSPLFTTTMSATSSSPALIACTSSPISGASSTTVVSAAAATSTSLWPVPTVSSRTMSKPRGVEHRRRDRRRRREAARVAARRHRADEHAVVARVRLHPDPVAEQRAAGDRRRRVDRHHRDRAPGLAQRGDQRRDERRLAGARRPGDADEVRAAGQRVQAAQRVLGDRRVVLDGRQQAREGAAVARPGGVGEGRGARRRGLGHVAARTPATRAASRWRG